MCPHFFSLCPKSSIRNNSCSMFLSCSPDLTAFQMITHLEFIEKIKVLRWEFHLLFGIQMDFKTTSVDFLLFSFFFRKQTNKQTKHVCFYSKTIISLPFWILLTSLPCFIIFSFSLCNFIFSFPLIPSSYLSYKHALVSPILNKQNGVWEITSCLGVISPLLFCLLIFPSGFFF